MCSFFFFFFVFCNICIFLSVCVIPLLPLTCSEYLRKNIKAVLYKRIGRLFCFIFLLLYFVELPNLSLCVMCHLIAIFPFIFTHYLSMFSSARLIIMSKLIFKGDKKRKNMQVSILLLLENLDKSELSVTLQSLVYISFCDKVVII